MMKPLLAWAAISTAFMGAPLQAATPVGQHGALSVSGTHVVDAHGKPVALSGVSFFWDNNGYGQERFYTAGTVHRFVRDWHVSLIRAAMGVETPGGYMAEPKANRARVDTLVKAARKDGIYVIIDWHSHHADEHPEAAVAFFQDMARTYGKLPNVIYEVYNEPLREADWHTQVKPYAEKVIDAIRAIDPDNLIIVGSPAWDQDVDVAAADPITGRANIAYALHFYAGTHRLDIRSKAQKAIDLGAPLFVSEWGTVNADGKGAVDAASTQAWQVFLRANCLSQANWAVSDKAESASIFKPGTSATRWTDADLTPSGLLVRDLVRDTPMDCR